ncbi:MAG TPA: TonB-dependent receptor, partial [Caulobacteraceae bacterium]|nr:TonB-dependent receptor [Caulobacteraceae bacterium]
VQPLGANTVLTIVGVYNHIDQGISLGATAAQIAKFGPNHGLSRDPTNQNFFGYNRDFINSDFEYADLQSNLGAGWTLDIKAYTYAYFHRGLNGEDPNGEFPNTTTLVGGLVTNDVPGQLLQNDYRSVGTISRFSKDFDTDWFKGDVDFGVWYDHQINARSLFEVDMTQGLARNIDPNTGANPDGVDRQLHQTLQTIQAYLQVDWKPIEHLTLTPGFRYAYFNRSVDADVNVGSGLAQNFDNTFETVLPSFSANYLFTPNWSSYLQVAAGALAPNENFFNHLSPSTTKLDPQTSWNYQIGTSYQDHRIAASIDGYYIDFSNLITSKNVGADVIFINNGGVTYEGIEADVTYNVGYGVSLYANGSINSARSQTTGQKIQNAPDATAAFGILYSQGRFSASLIDKWVGSRFGASGETQGLDPFNTLDLAVGYDLPNPSQWVKDTSIKVQVNNLTDDTQIINLAGFTVGAGTPLYWTNPGRSVFVTIAGKF